MNVGKDAPFVHHYTDWNDGYCSESWLKTMSDEGNSDEGKTDVAERIIIDTLIELTDELINGLEQRTFMTEQELSLLNEKSHGEKSKHLIQLPLDEMFES